MAFYNQIFIILFIVILLLCIIIFSYVKNVRFILGLSSGIPQGKKIPDINCENNNELIKITDSIKNDDYSFLFIIKSTCPACKDILLEINRLPNHYKNIKLLVVKERSETKKINLFGKDTLTYSISENEAKKLNINLFPFGIVVNSNGEVLKNGPIFKSNYLNFINFNG